MLLGSLMGVRPHRDSHHDMASNPTRALDLFIEKADKLERLSFTRHLFERKKIGLSMSSKGDITTCEMRSDVALKLTGLALADSRRLPSRSRPVSLLNPATPRS